MDKRKDDYEIVKDSRKENVHTYNYDTALKEAKDLLADLTERDPEIEKDDNR